MTLPVMPVDTLTVSRLAIFSIQVGPMAVFVPPGSFVGQSTVCHSNVIVSVLGGEGTALVIDQCIPSCAIILSYPEFV